MLEPLTQRERRDSILSLSPDPGSGRKETPQCLGGRLSSRTPLFLLYSGEEVGESEKVAQMTRHVGAHVRYAVRRTENLQRVPQMLSYWT